MEIEDQWEVVRGASGERSMDDPGVADLDRTAGERLVERDDREVRRE